MCNAYFEPVSSSRPTFSFEFLSQNKSQIRLTSVIMAVNCKERKVHMIKQSQISFTLTT